MISAGFYPTTIQFDAPSYAPTFHLTDEIMDCDANAFSSYYWLGWLAWENFPDCWKLSGYTLTNTELIFNIATQPQNINIGYASKYGGTSGGNNVYPECYHESPLVNVGSPSARYINKLDVMGVGNSGVNFGWHCSYIYGEGDSLTNRSYKDGSFTKAGKALYDFLYGDETQTITLATGITYELDFNNMDEDGSFHFTTTYNDIIYDFVISFSYCALRNMQNVSSTATAGTRNVNAYPMYSLTMDDDIYSFMATDAAFYHPSGYPCCIINKSTQQPTANTSAGNIIGDYIANGLECTIPKAFITSSPSYSRLITGNAHVFNRGSDIAVYRMLTRSEMQKIVGLSLRQSDGTYTTYGYQNELSYAPYVTEDNEFTATLITGDLSDDEFKAKLRPWQYDVDEWAENDYTEDDLPPYEPGGGGGEPDEGDWGTSILPFSQTTFGSTSFSRFELLNQAGVNELLGKLWAAPQSFWEGLSISKQLAANLSDYILSLRAYPVALNAGNAHNTIYIGASSGIDIQQGLYTPTLVNRIPLGALRISRQYNNFLDYNPYTAASIYLPFCGTVEINPKYLYDAALYLTLFVDCTDGSGVWVLVREGDDGKSFPVLLRQCRVGVDIPITGLDTSQMASNIVNATIQTGQHALQTVNKVTGAAAQVGAAVATGGAIGAEGAANLATMGGSIALQGLADATNMAMANKEIPFYTSGSGGAAAAEGNTEPFITLRRPLVSNPSNFAHTVGNLVNKTATISSLNGFTICRNVDVNGIGQATDKEKAQIKQIMESGFYA